MDPRSRLRWIIALSLVAWSLVVPAAAAYVDPGSTSFVFQALIAFAMATGLTVKMYWRRVRRFFAKDGEAEPDAGEHEGS